LPAVKRLFQALIAIEHFDIEAVSAAPEESSFPAKNSAAMPAAGLNVLMGQALSSLVVFHFFCKRKAQE
jgi:hypothetical protein